MKIERDWGDLARALADRFRLDMPIGRGGMSTVFLAHDLRHDRPVALKVIREDVSATVGIKRFEREIRIVARLTHPNILPLFDSGQVDQQLYYAMPYVEGPSLRARLEDGPFAVDEAVRITTEIAHALEHAHNQDVIHRDVKPDNVLVIDERAVVTDFGLARVVASAQEELTQSGFVVGTPAYMSPEQVQGRRALDHRVDQYGLACTLFELLTGRPPFVGRSVPEVLEMHARYPAPLVRELVPAVSRHIEATLERALNKHPDDRFDSMAAFREALTPVSSRRSGWLDRIRGWR